MPIYRIFLHVFSIMLFFQLHVIPCALHVSVPVNSRRLNCKFILFGYNEPATRVRFTSLTRHRLTWQPVISFNYDCLLRGARNCSLCTATTQIRVSFDGTIKSVLLRPVLSTLVWSGLSLRRFSATLIYVHAMFTENFPSSHSLYCRTSAVFPVVYLFFITRKHVCSFCGWVMFLRRPFLFIIHRP